MKKLNTFLPEIMSFETVNRSSQQIVCDLIQLLSIYYINKLIYYLCCVCCKIFLCRNIKLDSIKIIIFRNILQRYCGLIMVWQIHNDVLNFLFLYCDTNKKTSLSYQQWSMKTRTKGSKHIRPSSSHQCFQVHIFFHNKVFVVTIDFLLLCKLINCCFKLDNLILCY